MEKDSKGALLALARGHLSYSSYNVLMARFLKLREASFESIHLRLSSDLWMTCFGQVFEVESCALKATGQ